MTIDGHRLLVAVADDPEERSQGLSGVPDTAGLDGMLFIFEEPRILQFNMGDMRFPLDLWFIDDSGTIVGTETMVPCPSEPCPLYPSEDEVSRALETPQDMFDFAVGDQVIFD